MMNRVPPVIGTQSTRFRLIRLWSGILIGNLAAAGLFFAVQRWVAYMNIPMGALLAVPNILLVPAFGGLVASWIWRKLHLTILGNLIHSVSMTAVGIIGAAVFLGEGAVCLVIATPALYVTLLTGILLGRLLFMPRDNGVRLVMLPLLAFLAHAETQFRSDQQEAVTDEILIHAPPARVWPHVLAFPRIQEPPDYWIFRLGLPCPMETTNGGNQVGADRQCVFSDGVVIHERISEFIPQERLTFEVSEQPTHPESYGHVTLHRGRFDLRDNHDGTTTLIGTSWYTLHVRPLWYFNLWTEDMTRQVHLRVMRHIQRLAESPP
jgi:hypothetical protein